MSGAVVVSVAAIDVVDGVVTGVSAHVSVASTKLTLTVSSPTVSSTRLPAVSSKHVTLIS